MRNHISSPSYGEKNLVKNFKVYKGILKSIDLKHSLISVDENNRYGYPKDSVLLDILKDINIYRLNLDGSKKVINKEKSYINK